MICNYLSIFIYIIYILYVIPSCSQFHHMFHHRHEFIVVNGTVIINVYQ